MLWLWTRLDSIFALCSNYFSICLVYVLPPSFLSFAHHSLSALSFHTYHSYFISSPPSLLLIHFLSPPSVPLPLFFSFSVFTFPSISPCLLLYFSLQLTGMVGDGSIEGRQAIEGAVGSKAKAQSLAQARSMRAKTFIAKNKNPKLGNLPKRKFWNFML